VTDDRLLLVGACLAEPLDDTPRLVLADWFQEHDDEPQAANLRARGQWWIGIFYNVYWFGSDFVLPVLFAPPGDHITQPVPSLADCRCVQCETDRDVVLETNEYVLSVFFPILAPPAAWICRACRIVGPRIGRRYGDEY
jgi:uncharacterized protein (TIGR02996 family)